MYEVFKYVHILCAMAWVGGGFYAELLVLRAARSSDPEEYLKLVRHLDELVPRVFIPASILQFVAGVAMTIQRWSFADTWISISIVAWVAAILGGSLYLGPLARRGLAHYEAEGPTSVAGRAILDRLFLLTRIELIVFAIVIGLMVVKPNVG